MTPLRNWIGCCRRLADERAAHAVTRASLRMVRADNAAMRKRVALAEAVTEALRAHYAEAVRGRERARDIAVALAVGEARFTDDDRAWLADHGLTS